MLWQNLHNDINNLNHQRSEIIKPKNTSHDDVKGSRIEKDKSSYIIVSSSNHTVSFQKTLNKSSTNKSRREEYNAILGITGGSQSTNRTSLDIAPVNPGSNLQPNTKSSSAKTKPVPKPVPKRGSLKHGRATAFPMQNNLPKRSRTIFGTKLKSAPVPGNPSGNGNGNGGSFPEKKSEELIETADVENQQRYRDVQDETDRQEERYNSFDFNDVVKELKRQQSKKSIRIRVGNNIFVIDNSYGYFLDELQDVLAQKVYNSIRLSNKDVKRIANKTGYKIRHVQTVKDHVFYRKHKLDMYEMYGESITMGRFDANLKQGISWYRFEAGLHTEKDKTWMMHEYAEQHHEQTFDSGYRDAHNRAEKKFPGHPWDNEL